MGRKITKRELAVLYASPFRCRDCAHAYDPHSPSLSGENILCRCPFKQKGGKFCIFLSDLTCDRFQRRANGDKLC